MCGRATLTTPADTIAEIFEAPAIDIGPPRFNLAPSQPLLTVRAVAPAGGRELAFVRWGLVPWWAKPDEVKKVGARCIQARAEGVRKAPAFRDAFRRRRCLVVVDGFFEWAGEGKERSPFLAQRPGAEPFAIAGLWDEWRGEDLRLESGAVLTTRATGAVRAVHDRMPLVLPRAEWPAWLAGTPEEAGALLVPHETDLTLRPVSRWVNDPRHDDPACLAPPNDAA